MDSPPHELPEPECTHLEEAYERLLQLTESNPNLQLEGSTPSIYQAQSICVSLGYHGQPSVNQGPEQSLDSSPEQTLYSINSGSTLERQVPSDTCRVIENGIPCNISLTREDYPEHFEKHASSNVSGKFDCQWMDCGRRGKPLSSRQKLLEHLATHLDRRLRSVTCSCGVELVNSRPYDIARHLESKACTRNAKEENVEYFWCSSHGTNEGEVDILIERYRPQTVLYPPLFI
ncbi:hypothetical protein GYMLUDRAFT_64413 [Collybiopsis luxurians FD-317 M1]|uniref:C2H2-type domain-containing protein n=1 Tax=Collybiopsis luxurians FD-317 M1 TaxID=944289 RepID=A0A0D0BCF0_9AGAR|nr:hypothetical protein GYMLUDRAFT_64413 [Collybiopsis luxurians FD-317 M1]